MIQTIRVTSRIALLSALAACAGSSQAAPAAPAQTSPPPQTQPAAPASSTPASSSPSRSSPDWLTADSAGRVATLSLEVTAPPGVPSAVINGSRAGAARVTVPRGWTVKWNWRSADSTAPHSLVVMVEREKIPLEGGRPAFSNAMTRMVTSGLKPGQPDQTTFEADEPGWYWLLCGVPGHALNGEWISLRVDPEATTAGVQLK